MPPFGGPEQVLKYLARYTHRVAISNHRLVALEDGEVTFRWKDYAHGRGQKTMTLKASRVRSPVPPARAADGVRADSALRLPGQPGASGQARAMPRLLELETTPEPVAPEPAAAPQATVDAQAVTTTCPSCGVGRMVTVATLKAIPLDQRRCAPILQPIAFDTS